MQPKSKKIFFKLVVLDLDGTVLRSNKTVSQRFRNTLANAVNEDVKFVFASGRTLESVTNLINQIPELPSDTFVIACNGAIIWHKKNSEVIKTELLEQKDISVINGFASEINTPCYLIQGCILYTPLDEKFTLEARKYSTLSVKSSGINWQASELVAPKMMFIASCDEIDSIQEKIPVSLRESYYFVRSEPHYLEVMRKGVNKGSACQFLSHHLGIPSSHIIAIGDEYNDVEMLKFAGLGVAMGNARREVKMFADRVTLSNDCDGVSYAIEQWVLKKR